MTAAIVFDLDGVLLDSEPVWEEARRSLVEESGRPYPPQVTTEIMGMSAPEWSRYLHDRLGVPLEPSLIGAAVVARVEAAYRAHLPLYAGAVDAVCGLATYRPLAVASSSNRSLIELALELAGIKDCFSAIVSSEEVARGKPAPDVYLRAAELLAVPPEKCAAVEDSSNGMRSAHAAGMRVIAIPNRQFPPAPDALALAAVVISRLSDLNPDVIG